jgi:hypothetical protein
MATEYEFGEDDELTITTLWYAWDPFCAEWVVTDEVVSTGPYDYYYLENGYVKMHLEKLHMEYWVKYEMDEDQDQMILYLDAFVAEGSSTCLKGAWDMSLLSAQSASGQKLYADTRYTFDGDQLTITTAKPAGSGSYTTDQVTTRYTDYGTCWRYFDGSLAKVGTFDPTTDVFYYQVKDNKLFAYQKKQTVQLDKQSNN